MRLKTSLKNSKLSPIRPLSKMPDTFPPPMPIVEQLSSQCIPSSHRLICSWAAACTLPIGQRADSRSIHIVIVLILSSHILISNNALIVISKETKSTVSGDFIRMPLSGNPPLKLPFEVFEACFHCWVSFWILAQRLSIVIKLLLCIVDHILSWKWEDVIQRKIAAGTMHMCLGIRCAIGLLATINNEIMRLVD